MRLLMLLLVFQVGYTGTVVRSGNRDAIELNPLDFVPLAVGNRWMYKHVYIKLHAWAWGAL